MNRIESFDDLLAKTRAGDAAATERLMALARPWIEQVARNCLTPHTPDRSVSDLVQEAWLHAWQKLDQFQGAADEGESLAMFRSWLARIVMRLGANAARRRGAKANAARNAR